MSLPLAGVSVLDLTRMLPGNYCAWLLASLGADVVKIEDPGAGDYMRTFGHQVDGQGAAHHIVNRAKRSAVLDLKHPEGRDALLRMVDSADVVIESFRPGVLDRLGLGKDVLIARRPSLVVVSISAYGADGPHSQRPAHDINAVAFSGFLERIVGPGDGEPPAMTLPLADVIGGSLLPAVGIVSLLYQARETGRGGWIDASLMEGFTLIPSVQFADVLGGAPLPPRGVQEFGDQPFYRVYQLADGMAAVGAVEPHFWAELCEVLDVPELLDAQWDDARKDEATALLAERFAKLTKAEVIADLETRDVCVTVLRTYEDVVQDDLMRERDLLRPGVDVSMQVLAPPFRIDGQRPPETRRAPLQGEHTAEILTEHGYSTDEIARLTADGAVGRPEARA
jgi:alpha-methylacyl-CoA racemase